MSTPAAAGRTGENSIPAGDNSTPAPPPHLGSQLSWPQPTAWKGKLAWKSLHALQGISLHHSPSLILFNFTNFSACTRIVNYEDAVIHWLISPEEPYLVWWTESGDWWPLTTDLGGRFTGRNYVNLTQNAHLASSGSKYPSSSGAGSKSNGSLCGTRWNFPSAQWWSSGVRWWLTAREPLLLHCPSTALAPISSSDPNLRARH